MYDKIVPRLNKVLFFEENSFKSTTMPIRDGDGWYIRGQFYVKDELTDRYNRTKPFYKHRRGNKDGDLGHAFPFIMCNKAYLNKYEKELSTDGYKPIVMKEFDPESATNVLAKKIKDAGDYISIDTLWKHLSLFADTEYDS
jgi:hypothetical protein